MNSVSAINVGIDVGSTTTKICALDARTHALLHTSYQRHGARQAESVAPRLAYREHVSAGQCAPCAYRVGRGAPGTRT